MRLAPLLLAACVSGREPADRVILEGPQLVVATTDYRVGALAAVDPSTGVVHDTLSSTSGDPEVVATGGRLVVLNRGTSDALRVFEGGDLSVPVVEAALPSGANAHGVAEVDGALFVSLYERSFLQVIDPMDGAELGRVDLVREADRDGLPEADAVRLADGRLFVSVQRLDRDAGWSPGTGRVVEVDPGTWEVLARWDVGPNPRVFPNPADPATLVVLTGVFYIPDGALSVFDPATGTLTELATEAELGADLLGFAGSGSHGLALGVDFDPTGPSTLHCIDLDSGAVRLGRTSGAWYAAATAGPQGDVWVGARAGFGPPGGDRGLLRFDPVACQLVGAPIPLLLEPYSLTLYDPSSRRQGGDP